VQRAENFGEPEKVAVERRRPALDRARWRAGESKREEC
jgi:hypothetical protein